MTKQTMIATAAAIFAASTFVASSAGAQVMCSGTNACKGQGISDTKDVMSCQNQGGKPLTQ
jgi:poly(3-hydroxybutyrate) depolymerase